MAKDKTIVIRGRLDWAKILGAARPYTGNPKYDKGPYWSVDITPDADSLKVIEDAGITKKLREPKGNDTRKDKFLSLKVLERKANGEKNDPPKVVDIRNQPWGDALLGNGTIADVKIKVKDYGAGVEKGAYLQAVRILKHVPYEGGGFDELSEDDEFFAADETPKSGPGTAAPPADDDLDDDVPF